MLVKIIQRKHGYFKHQKLQQLQRWRNYCSVEWGKTPVKDADSVDATWRISSSSLRMCARQDCFVFERPQVVFYCNFSSSRHVSKSANLIGRIVFDAECQTKKTNPRRFFFKWRFYTWRFSRRCAHSHWRPLFSHEALNVCEYRAWNSSRCVRAFSCDFHRWTSKLCACPINIIDFICKNNINQSL